MWAITHVTSGTVVTNYKGSLFYSEREARLFLRKTKRLLNVLRTIYLFDDYCEMKATRYQGPLFFLGAKPGKNNYLKFRFYRNQEKHDACEESTRKLLMHFGNNLKLIPNDKITAFYNQIKQAHLYFIIHRVN
jgi:hypothetical protein